MGIDKLRELLKAEREIDEEVSKVEARLESPNPFLLLVPWQFVEEQSQLRRRRDALLEQKKRVTQQLSQIGEPAGTAPSAKHIDHDEEAVEKVGKGKSPIPAEARARTVASIIKELEILKPQMYVESDYEGLKERNPAFLTFEVAEKRPHLRKKVINLQAHQRFYRLAQELAAAYHGRELSTLQSDWKRYKPREFRRKPS